jgi:hypothetical protein
MTARERRAVRQAITDLHAGLPAEGVLLRILLAIEAESRPVDAGQEEPMKVVVETVMPGAPGAVDVHISLRDLRPGQEMAVAGAFSSIQSALDDGKVSFLEGLSIAMALAAVGR